MKSAPVTKPDLANVDVLIIGAGPAGASLACFLAQYEGLSIMMISRAKYTAKTPRAHITNVAALECLRDIDLDKKCAELASPQSAMLHTRWVESFLGEEYCRLWSWGNDPTRKGEYEASSPCRHCDLPQSLLEPILVRDATMHGVTVRFDTEFISFKEISDKIVETKLHDRVNGHEYVIRSKFLVGADGANSKVVTQLGLELVDKPKGPIALNILCEVDLSKYMDARVGNLTWILHADENEPQWGWLTNFRMVRPWTEWLLIVFVSPAWGVTWIPTEEEYIARIRKVIGCDVSIPIKFTGVSKWQVNETYGLEYSKGRIFAIGDAVHRHPPMNGLGSNTCIQDSFNLAWKMAYVLKGLARPELLNTYTRERQPVGLDVVTTANDALRNYAIIWEALVGNTSAASVPDPTVRLTAYRQLSQATPEGAARRKLLQKGLKYASTIYHSLGREMNQLYSSMAIVNEESGPFVPIQDPVKHYQKSTYPGRRLPHVWLRHLIPDKPLISTIDLTGKMGFTVFTGIGGHAWKTAAVTVSKKFRITINAYSIGMHQDYEDTYLDWEAVREIEDDGCILVRPDRFVAWRSKTMLPDAEERLTIVLKNILAWVVEKA